MVEASKMLGGEGVWMKSADGLGVRGDGKGMKKGERRKRDYMGIGAFIGGVSDFLQLLACTGFNRDVIRLTSSLSIFYSLSLNNLRTILCLILSSLQQLPSFFDQSPLFGQFQEVQDWE